MGYPFTATYFPAEMTGNGVVQSAMLVGFDVELAAIVVGVVTVLADNAGVFTFCTFEHAAANDIVAL